MTIRHTPAGELSCRLLDTTLLTKSLETFSVVLLRVNVVDPLLLMMNQSLPLQETQADNLPVNRDDDRDHDRKVTGMITGMITDIKI